MKNRNFKIWGILWWLVTNITVEHLKVQFEVIVISCDDWHLMFDIESYQPWKCKLYWSIAVLKSAINALF
jgi:hypothetical protein